MKRTKAKNRPSDFIASRLTKLRETLVRKNLDGYLITNRIDQYYLTHFDGEDGAILVLPHQVFLITDGRFAEDAERSAPWAKAIIRTGKLSDALAKVVRQHRIDRLGFDPAEMTLQLSLNLRTVCRPTRLVTTSSLLVEMRQIKDAGEIEAITRAIEVAEEAFRIATQRIRIGMTERQLAANLLHEMLKLGASDASFPIIVAEGSASSRPHARAGDRTIKAGSAVLIDWGATVDHYRSDLTRVLFIRKIPPRFRRMADNVLAAQSAAIAAIRPGAALAQVDQQARHLLKQRGMDKAFTHGLGHGIGLDIHEAPRLSSQAKGQLRAGMVVTVEPGVYFPGVGGVRIEDDVL
ncbi:MAG: Xaa-Pro peptidase family protein, partial [Phycisphaerae bacterium]|nr:Xaa-Pro peptidase family protein [Phycisphaerae bacterium]